MQTDRLLYPKELAEALRRSESYVYAMRARGFQMPGGTATLAEAKAWLTANPQPRRRETGPILNQKSIFQSQ